MDEAWINQYLKYKNLHGGIEIPRRLYYWHLLVTFFHNSLQKVRVMLLIYLRIAENEQHSL
jgi:hypothetical protein